MRVDPELDVSTPVENPWPPSDNGGPSPTYGLLPGSPALDAGSLRIDEGAGSCEPWDQRLLARPKDGPTATVPEFDGHAVCDIGAFEYGSPKVSIRDGGSVTEGDSGTKRVSFRLSLSFPYVEPVSVGYKTEDGTATTANSDYEATSGVVAFAPGEVSKSVVVRIVGDTRREPDETFKVRIPSVTRPARIGDGTAKATIVNDD